MGAQNQRRYLKYLIEYDKALPADLTQEQRLEALLEALDELAAKDSAQVAAQATQDINQLYDQTVLVAETQTGEDVTSQLDQIRQSI